MRTGAAVRIRSTLALAALLAERFQLRTHTETRQLPVFALIPAGRTGAPGPQLKRFTGECAGAAETRQGPACGTSVAPGTIRIVGATIAELASALSRLTNTGSSLNRTVIDRSGFEGRFDGELRFTPEHTPAAEANQPGTPNIDPNGPTIFTAVQEQLGLKLDPQQAPIEVLVVDRIERPSAN